MFQAVVDIDVEIDNAASFLPSTALYFALKGGCKYADPIICFSACHSTVGVKQLFKDPFPVLG